MALWRRTEAWLRPDRGALPVVAEETQRVLAHSRIPVLVTR